MKNFFFLMLVLFLFSCEKEPVLQESVLSEYLELNSDLGRGDIIACAGGKEGGLFRLPYFSIQ